MNPAVPVPHRPRPRPVAAVARPALALVAAVALLGVAPIPLPAAPAAAEETTIESDELEMQGTVDRNFFYFNRNVRVHTRQLQIECDLLEVIAARTGDPGATVGKIGAIESIVATGRVVIRQAGREARAGKAVMDPVTGRLTLLEKPRIIDGETVVSGGKIILTKDKTVQVIPDDTPGIPRQRTSVVLGGDLPEFNFNQPAPPAPKPAETDWMTGEEPPSPTPSAPQP